MQVYHHFLMISNVAARANNNTVMLARVRSELFSDLGMNHEGQLGETMIPEPRHVSVSRQMSSGKLSSTSLVHHGVH